MQVVLVMFRSDGERRSFSVVRNMTVIGRREDCDLRIPVGDVSRKHCRLVRTDDGIRIEDLGSSNGTFVNGQRVQESELNPGDQVGVGPVQFVVQIDGVPEDDQIKAPSIAAFDPEDSMAVMSPAGDLEELPPADGSPEEIALEEVPLEEASLEAEPAAKEQLAPRHGTVRRPPVPPPPMTEPELEIDDNISPAEMPLDEVAMEPAAMAHLPTDPSMPHQAPEFEIVDFAEAEPAKHDVVDGDSDLPAVPGKPVEDLDWDLEIEDHETNESHGDFKIDVDASHKQPHG